MRVRIDQCSDKSPRACPRRASFTLLSWARSELAVSPQQHLSDISHRWTRQDRWHDL